MARTAGRPEPSRSQETPSRTRTYGLEDSQKKPRVTTEDLEDEAQGAGSQGMETGPRVPRQEPEEHQGMRGIIVLPKKFPRGSNSQPFVHLARDEEPARGWSIEFLKRKTRRA